MKLISLWQPWATAMPTGWKLNETRSWSTKYRGETAIHAAKQNGVSGLEIDRLAVERLTMGGLYPCAIPKFPRGCIVGLGDLVDVVPVEDYLKTNELTPLERAWGDYSPGRFVWIFNPKVRPIIPLPYKAAQGLRDLPEAIVSQVEYLRVA